MNFLQRLLGWEQSTEDVDLACHDQQIEALEWTRDTLQQWNDEPMTRRIRGQYPRHLPPAEKRHRPEPQP